MANLSPDVIEAGVQAWHECESCALDDEVAAIYLAMRKADQPSEEVERLREALIDARAGLMAAQDVLACYRDGRRSKAIQRNIERIDAALSKDSSQGDGHGHDGA